MCYSLEASLAIGVLGWSCAVIMWVRQRHSDRAWALHIFAVTSIGMWEAGVWWDDPRPYLLPGDGGTAFDASHELLLPPNNAGCSAFNQAMSSAIMVTTLVQPLCNCVAVTWLDPKRSTPGLSLTTRVLGLIGWALTVVFEFGYEDWPRGLCSYISGDKDHSIIWPIPPSYNNMQKFLGSFLFYAWPMLFSCCNLRDVVYMLLGVLTLLRTMALEQALKEGSRWCWVAGAISISLFLEPFICDALRRCSPDSYRLLYGNWYATARGGGKHIARMDGTTGGGAEYTSKSQ